MREESKPQKSEGINFMDERKLLDQAVASYWRNRMAAIKQARLEQEVAK